MNLLHYILSEVKSKRLQKADAIDLIKQHQAQNLTGRMAPLHPLLHQNTSDLSEQRFSTTLSGEEFFLADHRVQGKRVLPGVAYLEMARAAIQQATGQTAMRLKNVVFVRPVIVDAQAAQLHIGLYPEDNGDIGFEIYSRRAGEEEAIHSQGTVELLDAAGKDAHDIATLRAQCDRLQVAGTQCYDAFNKVGLEYGASHRALQELHVGQQQVLAKLTLPAVVSDTKEQFILHPSLMDGALQASIGLLIDGTDPANSKPMLPFALEEVEVMGKCSATMWTVVRYSAGSQPGDKLQKLDIDVCDEQGAVCVRLKGFTSRVLDKVESAGEKSHEAVTAVEHSQADTVVSEDADSLVGNVTLLPVWDPVPIPAGQPSAISDGRMVVVCNLGENGDALRQQYPDAHVLEIENDCEVASLSAQLEAQGHIDHIVWVAPADKSLSLDGDGIIAAQKRGVVQCFRLVKALLALGYDNKNLAWSVITTQTQAVHPNEPVLPAHASVHGLIGTMAKEYPCWKVRLVDLPLTAEFPAAQLLQLPVNMHGDAIALRGNQWYGQRLVRSDIAVARTDAYRNGGVYVVIGGAGGLGEVWSEHMIRTHNAKVVWIGRRQLNDDIQGKIDRLSAFGPAPEYVAADATDLQAMRDAYASIKEKHGQIHGVVHSAIALLDKTLANMEEDRFVAGLAAKVDTCVRLAQVFAGENLDFVLFFSSVQSFSKAPGQSNYAAGCVFKDAFAAWLNKQWSCAVKIVNWGYWGSIGIVASQEYQERMARFGIGSIEPAEGLSALDLLLNGACDQMAFIKTTQPTIPAAVAEGDTMRSHPAVSASFIEDIRAVGNRRLSAEPAPAERNEGISLTVEAVSVSLLKIAADIIKVAPEEIDMAGSLQEYGFDPVLSSELVQRFNLEHGTDIPVSDIFLCTSLQEFVQSLMTRFGDAPVAEEPISAILDRLTALKKEAHAYFAKSLWSQLQSLGLFANGPIRKQDIASARRDAGILDMYARWFDESLNALQRAGYIEVQGELLVPVQTVADAQAGLEGGAEKAAWSDDPVISSQAALVEAMLASLPEILTGKVAATDVMFPKSSLELVENIYKHNPVAHYFNEVLADSLIAYIEARIRKEGTPRIRLLEVGAGTGATSACLFQKLKPYQQYIEEYCYTDISRMFLFHAEKTFGPDNPYLTYRLFDVSKPLSGQDIKEADYDIAIATNVLHATKDIRQSIRNTKAILRTNGLLIINEMSDSHLAAHLTFGLLEGWWLYQDAELRIPGCPALYPEGWQSVLEAEGFSQVLFPAETTHALGQQIVVAESNGVVRQSRPAAARIETVAAQTSVALPAQNFDIEVLPASRNATGVSHDLLKEKSTAYLRKLVSDTLKIPVNKIDTSESLAKYGIDSLLVVQLTGELRNSFGNVSSTVFFEHQTIDALVSYFIQTQPESLVKLVGLEGQAKEVVPALPAPPVLQAAPVARSAGSRRSKRFLAGNKTGATGVPQQGLLVQDVAIIGVSGRYPDAQNLSEFWNHLKSGKNCIREVPGDRWDWKKYFGEKRGVIGSIYTKWGGFLPEIDKFDPLFFQISPREAEIMSPQERLFLEEAYASIEDAGYTPQTLCDSRKVGIFVGAMNETYPTGARYWSIANRVSYFMNFQGPSMAVDTACSSSLTAIHLALESLYSGTSDCAIAGGVNLIISPAHFMGLSAAAMLSAGDKCRAFGANADGFVDGEGVGAVVLKPLHKAVKDGDHIYGVIKASMVNAGGKTHGYMVPNPNAQAQLIAGSLKRAGINPRTLSYVEAHGTGTSLGDPIEIAGLSKAFQEFTADKQFCAIGSAKSNIGHCESAAGIAGVTKVLLQLKHGQLVPSLHSAEPNPNIDFANSPFAVQQELAEWQRPTVTVDGVTKEYPRIASVSSFGAGGANAHVVIEEYAAPQPKRVGASASNPALVVLSARNEERLKARVEQLLAWVEANDPTAEDLADLAYTLQVGREAMEERLALLVVTPEELKTKLAAIVGGDDSVDDVYRGQVKRNKDSLGAFAADEDMAKIVDAWVAKGKYGKLLDMWVKGLTFEWNKLHGAARPRKISLPSYPFAKERYWVDASIMNRDALTAALGAQNAVLHPLLHQNTSDLSEQRFSTTLSGEEFFLADHRVQGKRVLPGVAYLEMARAAIQQATGQTAMRLKNVVFVRPVIVDAQAAQLHIGLYPEDNGDIGFEIYSRRAGEEEAIHSQGTVELLDAAGKDAHDIATLRAQCDRLQVAGTQCYDAFNKVGLEYGASHRALQELHVGQQQVLAKLTLPAVVSDTKEQFILHPSLMDGALQASIGLLIDGTDPANSKPMLPFALEEVEVMGKCSATMWTVVRYSAGSQPGDKLQKLDIDVCDEQGAVCVRLKGFTSRVLDKAPQAQSSASTTPEIARQPETVAETLLMQPDWQVRNVSQSGKSAIPVYAKHLVVVCGLRDVSAEYLGNRLDGIECHVLPVAADGIAQQYGQLTQTLLAQMQAIFASRPAGEVLVQIVVPTLGEQQLLAGLSGLIKAARIESAKIKGQVIEVDEAEGNDSLIEKLLQDSASPADQQIRYQDGERWVKSWKDIGIPADIKEMPWKAQGIYLVTGGTGGLGFLFAREIAQQAAGARLILTGRSAADAEKQAQLEELNALGANAEYRQVDVADRSAVEQLMQAIRETHGTLHGIVHSAGVTRDSLILHKTAEETQAVLSPKVAGLINLDEASKDMALDCFICFSSLSGALGNAGQADYAAGNAFMDSYAAYRNTLAALQKRHGRTLSLNWPLWKEGGMRLDETTQAMLKQNTGMEAMDTASGIDALYRAWSCGADQVLVMHGNAARMKSLFLFREEKPVETKKQPVPAGIGNIGNARMDDGELLAKVRSLLVSGVAGILKVRPEDIDGDAELNEYGFDSITLTEFGVKINQEYKLDLTPTVFFEHPTLNQFAEYLVREHRAVFEEKFGGGSWRTQQAVADAVPNEAAASPAPQANVASRRRFRASASHQAHAARTPAAEPIAVVGMSGCFPMAKDLQEFWNNLVEGKDCISEIPSDRWDWRKYYGDPHKEANKTNIKWGGFIDGAAEFDPLFFGISPKEAELMDPQQRLLMTHVWKAIEDAGYSASSLSGSNTAIFVGTAHTGYGGLVAKAKVAIEGYSSTGSVSSVGPNRMSYFLNLHGPSEPIETACSSSLVAIRKGILAIESGDCDMAIVGGINTILMPEMHISFNKAGMLCEDGRCKTFSAQANGYVRGEGVGMLVLKRLSVAEQAGDHIYGVLKGSAENHGGRSNSLTAPNPKAQAELLKSAYRKANIDPRSVSYIEAHGTGTALGDPIEINGLKAAFKEMVEATGASAPADAHCGLGSVKTNIGHLELAAGVAGVIKVLLQLKHKTLVKTLHCDTVNPYIDLKDAPFYIVRETQEWKALRDSRGNELPRRAGVSSFGFGGANAHVVIEEYVPRNTAQSNAGAERTGAALVVLSAKNPERLHDQARQLYEAIVAGQIASADLHNLAYTLQVGREAMEERLALIVGSVEELKQKLQAVINGEEVIDDVYRGQVKRNKETLSVFAADEELQDAIDKWVQRGKYGKLLDLWVKGLVFDWNKLYGNTRSRRLSLPTYPFAKERYWVTDALQRSRTEQPAAESPEQRSVQQYLQSKDDLYDDLIDKLINDELSVEQATMQLTEEDDLFQ